MRTTPRWNDYSKTDILRVAMVVGVFGSRQSQAARNELQELQRKKAALSLELMSLEDASRNRKQGIRGTGAIPLNTEASILRSDSHGMAWVS